MKIFWTKRALSDAKNIQEYYLPILPQEILLDILDEIENSTNTISNFMEIGKLMEDGKTRKLVLTSYSYIILYVIKGGSINVTRVLDTRRKPVNK
jgi:plasmid stabilization system protein ParE